MDVDLDDLRSSCGDFGSSATSFGMANQDYILGFSNDKARPGRLPW